VTSFLQAGDLAEASRLLLKCALRRAGRTSGLIGIRVENHLHVLALHGTPEAGSTAGVTLASTGAALERGPAERPAGDFDGSPAANGLAGFEIVHDREGVGWLGMIGRPPRATPDDAKSIEQLSRSAGVSYSFDRLKDREAESRHWRETAERTVDVLVEEISTQHEADRIIGSSKALRDVIEQAERVAETVGTVLILGEPGTGKDCSRTPSTS
jgi:Sigma-54 interaction domain